MEKVLFSFEGTVKVLNKEELFNYISKRSLAQKPFGFCTKRWRYHRDLKTWFENSYDAFLKLLGKTTHIQVYDDLTIRLHLRHDFYEKKKNVFFEGKWCCDDSTLELLDDLITFSEHN